MTFINKLDREGRPPIELLDEIESVLKIRTAPVTWPIGMGRDLAGVYHLLEDRIYVYEAAGARRARHESHASRDCTARKGASSSATAPARFDDEIELVRGGTAEFDVDAYLRRPADAGVLRLGHLQFRRRRAAGAFRAPRAGAAAARDACSARSRPTKTSSPASCSRSRRTWIRSTAIASRSCACARASTRRGMRMYHVRLDKEMRIADALTFMAADRQRRGRSLRRRHHRPAQPRHHQHRRHLHRGREAHLHRHPELRAGNVPARGAQGSAQDQGSSPRGSTSCAKRARRSCSSRCATTT